MRVVAWIWVGLWVCLWSAAYSLHAPPPHVRLMGLILGGDCALDAEALRRLGLQGAVPLVEGKSEQASHAQGQYTDTTGEKRGSVGWGRDGHAWKRGGVQVSDGRSMDAGHGQGIVREREETVWNRGARPWRWHRGNAPETNMESEDGEKEEGEEERVCITDTDSLYGAALENFDPRYKNYRDIKLVKAGIEAAGLGFLCSGALKKLLEKEQGPSKTAAEGWGSFLDAMAKPPTAILGGQLQWVGGFEMCHGLQATYMYNASTNETRTFGGRYCRLMVGPRQKNGTAPLPLSLGFGMCLPDSCTAASIDANPGLLNDVLKFLNFEVKSTFCGHVLDFPTDTRAQAALIIIVVLIALVLCATLYDVCFRPSYMRYYLRLNREDKDVPYNGGPSFHIQDGWGSNILQERHKTHALHDPPGICGRLEAAFAGFSAAATFRQIFSFPDRRPGRLASVDAVRFLSLAYAMGGNTFLFGIIYTESITSSNLLAKMKVLPHEFIFQPIINYSFTADSFLVVSGVVVAYHWLRRVEKAGKPSLKLLIHFYLHRYWSLVPMMMFTIMLYTCLYKYLVSGPIIPPLITDAENCRSSWWLNLLMINNLVSTDSMCLGWTWHTGLLFQLHIVTPLILVPLARKERDGWLFLGILYVIYLAAVSAIVSNHVYGNAAAWYFDYILTPWCRAGPYLIGLAVGILIHKKTLNNWPKNCCTNMVSIMVWVVAVGAVALCTFVSYTKYRKEDPLVWTRSQTVAFHSLARSAWGLAVGWFILACEGGFGGLVNSILSYGAFLPLSRMTYPVYVIHAIFIFRYAYTQMDTIYITFHNMLYVYFGHIIFIFIVAIALSLIFHFPFMALERALFLAKTRLEIAYPTKVPEEVAPSSSPTETKEEPEEDQMEPRTLPYLEQSTFM